MVASEKQINICQKYNLEMLPPEPMVALALTSLNKMPIYGCRVKVTENENISWFFHCGEYSDTDDFYSPIHTSHLETLLPFVIPYLYLPSNTRFIIDDKGYEDVWIENSLV